MSWTTVYLVCFWLGFSLSAVSWLLGAAGTHLPHGTGEILFSLAGGRRVAGARSEDGRAIGKGVEIVIVRYEKGLAYVRTWAELSSDSART